MTNTKVNNNIIDLEELEIVSGGTVGELDDLIKALMTSLCTKISSVQSEVIFREQITQ